MRCKAKYDESRELWAKYVLLSFEHHKMTEPYDPFNDDYEPTQKIEGTVNAWIKDLGVYF